MRQKRLESIRMKVLLGMACSLMCAFLTACATTANAQQIVPVESSTDVTVRTAITQTVTYTASSEVILGAILSTVLAKASAFLESPAVRFDLGAV